MTQHSKSIPVGEGCACVVWSDIDGVRLKLDEGGEGSRASVLLDVPQVCEITAVLLTACRKAGEKDRLSDPSGDGEMAALAERLRSDQENVSSTDLQLAAGYLELLLRYIRDDRLS